MCEEAKNLHGHVRSSVINFIPNSFLRQCQFLQWKGTTTNTHTVGDTKFTLHLNVRIRRRQESIMNEQSLLSNNFTESAYLIEIVPRQVIIAVAK